MKRLVLLAAISVGLLSAAATASFPMQVPVQAYLDHADYVAYVRIESGAIQRVDGDICGERYQVQVLQEFKGDLPEMATISGGPGITPEEVGGSYLVFLKTRDGYDRRRQHYSGRMPEDFLSRCRTEEVYLEPSLVIGEEFGGGRPVFLVPSRIVVFPDDVVSGREVDAVGTLTVLDPVYVDRDRTLEYLRTMRSGDDDRDAGESQPGRNALPEQVR